MCVSFSPLLVDIQLQRPTAQDPSCQAQIYPSSGLHNGIVAAPPMDVMVHFQNFSMDIYSHPVCLQVSVERSQYLGVPVTDLCRIFAVIIIVSQQPSLYAVQKLEYPRRLCSLPAL